MSKRNIKKSVVSFSDKREKAKIIPSVSALNSSQKLVLKTIANESNYISFISGVAGTGKAQPLDSLVFTPYGPKKMGDIKINDEICSIDGKTTKVLGIFSQGKKEIYKIEFDNGDFVESCGEHLWKVDDRRKMRSRGCSRDITLTAKDIYSKLKNSDFKNRYTVEMPKPLFFNKKEVPIDPYVLGCILGDGNITHNAIVITSADPELIDNLNNKMPRDYYFAKQNNKYGYRLNNVNKSAHKNIFQKHVIELNLKGKNSYTKFIPKEYLINSIENRISILQGILDTDGYVAGKGRIEICISSEQLSKDIKFLVETLGGICHISTKIPTYMYKGQKLKGHVSYRCYIKFNDPEKFFRLTRKKEKCIKRSKYVTKRHIRNIFLIEKKECQCILVDHPSHLYITNNCIVTHNTHLAVSWALEQLIKGNFKKMVLTRPYVEAGESLGFLKGSIEEKFSVYLTPIMDILYQHLTIDEAKVLFEENKIMSLPLAYFRGLTFSNAVVILDEAQNATINQMNLFLTRIGKNSKMILTGDVTQSDIGQKNGLLDAINRLQGIPGIDFVELDTNSIVRHPIIGPISERYAKKD